MTEQLQTDYLYQYENIQVEIYQVTQFNEFNAVSTTYLGKANMPRKDAFRAKN